MATDNELKKLINKMNNKQIYKYVTVLIAASFPRFSNEFFKRKEGIQYLNATFISLGLICTISYDDRIHTRALTRARDRARDLCLSLNLDLALALDLDRAIDLALDLAWDRSLDLVWDRNRSLDLDRTLDRTIDRTIDLARDLDLSLDLDLDRAIAKAIIANENLAILPLLTEVYGDTLQRFLTSLNNVGGKYWTTFYKTLLENDLVPTLEQKEDLLAIPEDMYEETLEINSAYLLARHDKKVSFNETRLILLGNKGAGKTTFARRFLDLKATMPKNYESTEGVDFHMTSAANISDKYEQTDIKINIWDFAGHEVTHSAHKFFLSNEAVYVIICDGRTEDGGQKTASDWLEHIAYSARVKEGVKIPVFIVMNEKDNHSANITYDSVYDDRFDIQEYYINLKKDNQKNGVLDNLRNQILDCIDKVQKDRELVPASLVKIREALDQAKLCSYMSVRKTTDIIKKHYNGEYKIMLRLLHIFGVCFFYGDEIKAQNADVVVMNPRWTTNAIYSIINYIRKQNRFNGSINLKELSLVFNKKNEYPQEMIDFIANMATNFKLAYEKDNTLIFPCCITENLPKGKKDLQPTPNDILINIETISNGISSPPNIPMDIIPNLICNCYLNLDYCSRKAMILKKLGVNQNIVAEVTRVRADRISILVKGHDKDSCDVSETLTRLTYEAIQSYQRFKNEPPCISLTYTDERMHVVTEPIEKILGERWSEYFVPLKGYRNRLQKALEKIKMGINLKVATPNEGVTAEFTATTNSD